MACANSYISIKYIPKGGDIPLFYGDGLQLYKTLIQHPSDFLNQLGRLFTFNDVDVMNPHSGIINAVFGGIKFIHFLLDLFSFGNLYTNVIIFNGLSAWVFLHCSIFFKHILGTYSVGAWLFLMPSCFYNCSGILKEGILLILIAAFIPLLFNLLKRFTIAVLIKCTILFLLMVFFKFLIACTFLMALVLWQLMILFPVKKKLILISCTLVGVACFFLLGFVSTKLNFLQFIVNRQQEFLGLDAHSKINAPHLQSTFSSFLSSLPIALNNVFFKPLPGEGRKMLYFPFTVEIICFWVLLLLAWGKNKWNTNFKKVDPLVWSLFLFAIINLLIIGYTITNIGAITRYRSIFLPFVGLFFWMSFNGDKLFFRVNRKLN